jgi:hypothetical protein
MVRLGGCLRGNVWAVRRIGRLLIELMLLTTIWIVLAIIATAKWALPCFYSIHLAIAFTVVARPWWSNLIK